MIFAKRGIHLLLSCKTIYQNACEVYYESKTFRIMSPKDFDIFTAPGPLPGMKHFVRKLELGIDLLYIKDREISGESHNALYWQIDSGSGNQVKSTPQVLGTCFWPVEVVPLRVASQCSLPLPPVRNAPSQRQAAAPQFRRPLRILAFSAQAQRVCSGSWRYRGHHTIWLIHPRWHLRF